MSTAGNVKILVWLQFCTIVLAILFAWFYLDPQPTAARGKLDGILYAIENSTILVDGQALNEGDTLYGVKVVRIDRRKVTFEKDGVRWQQRVRDLPNPNWDSKQEDKK